MAQYHTTRCGTKQLEAGNQRTYIPGIEAGKRSFSLEGVEKLAFARGVSA
jgi:hypothetical protein